MKGKRVSKVCEECKKVYLVQLCRASKSKHCGRECLLTSKSVRVGEEFDRLMVMELVGVNSRGARVWKCKCKCGNEVMAESRVLRKGGKRSCGCLPVELTKERSTIHGFARHDGSRPPEYGIWHNIHYRCENPNNKDWHNYGGKGVKVCKRWADFVNFYDDMGPRPTSKHTIERKDGDGNYCPDNCVWAVMKVQQRNRNNNQLIEYEGEQKCLAEWAEILDMNYYNLWDRLFRSGWTVTMAFSTPTKRRWAET